MQYISSSHFQNTPSAKFISNTLNWTSLEKRPLQPDLSVRGPQDDGSQVDGRESQDTSAHGEIEVAAKKECADIFIPGGGFAKMLLEKWLVNHTP